MRNENKMIRTKSSSVSRNYTKKADNTHASPEKIEASPSRAGQLRGQGTSAAITRGGYGVRERERDGGTPRFENRGKSSPQKKSTSSSEVGDKMLSRVESSSVESETSSRSNNSPPAAVPISMLPIPQGWTAAVAHRKEGKLKQEKQPRDKEQQRLRDEEKLRNQLQNLVSTKLATLGDLDQAGLFALETLSKMPPAPSVFTSESKTSKAGAGTKQVEGGRPRPRRILPPGLESVPKFSGKDPSTLTDTLNRFHSLVVSALPGCVPDAINRALLRDVVFVLERSALKFFIDLRDGRLEWEPIPPAVAPKEKQAAAGGQLYSPPLTWAQVCDAFHDHFLPAEGIARTSAALLSLSQTPGESIPSLAGRQLGLSHHLNRLIDSHNGRTTFWEAMSIGLFERALRPDLRRVQHAESPCSTFQESVDRAERNAGDVICANQEHSKEAGGDVGASSWLEKSTQAHANASPPTEVSVVQQEKQQQRLLTEAFSGRDEAPSTVPTGNNCVATDVFEGHGFCKMPNIGGDKMQAAVKPAVATGSPKLADAFDGPSLLKLPIASSDSENNGRDGKSSNNTNVLKGCGDNQWAPANDLPRPTNLGSPLQADSREFTSSLHGDDVRAQGLRPSLSTDLSQYPLTPRDDISEGFRNKSEGESWKESNHDGRKFPKRGKRRGTRNLSPPLPPQSAKKRRHDGPDIDTGSAEPHFPPHFQHLASQEQLCDDFPPCTLTQCKSINRQFHASIDCFFHPQNGEYNRRRSGSRRSGKKPPPHFPMHREEEPVGYNDFNSNNSYGGYQGPPCNGPGFGGQRFF